MHQRATTFARQAEERYGFDVVVEEFPAGTKTASDAADAVGCAVGQIASSLVFEVGDGTDSGSSDSTDGDGTALVVVVTSGANRVSEAKLGAALDTGTDAVSMADPDEIRDVLGWSIGGVPPFCHETDVPVLFDESLLAYETVWAAAGTPNAVFPITPAELRRLSEAEVLDVVE
jgi:prolyl-tRNA editing enzyme YbaK/EbsC (Cys-tRNA(Pro) deacylase)